MGGKKKGPTDEEKAASAAKKAAEQKARAEVAIFKAARDDDVKRVEAAVAKGASVDAVTGDYDHTVMHRAAAYNALRVIKYLHSQGAKLDTPDASKEKLTPLQTAKKIALSADAAALIEALVEGRNVDGMFGGDADDSDGDDSDGGEGAAAAKPKAEAASSPRRRRRARRRPRGRAGRRRRRERRRRGAGRRRGSGVDGRGGVGGAAQGARMAWHAIMVGFIVAVAVAKLEYREESADACACTSVYTRNS